MVEFGMSEQLHPVALHFARIEAPHLLPRPPARRDGHGRFAKGGGSPNPGGRRKDGLARPPDFKARAARLRIHALDLAERWLDDPALPVRDRAAVAAAMIIAGVRTQKLHRAASMKRKLARMDEDLRTHEALLRVLKKAGVYPSDIPPPPDQPVGLEWLS